MRLHGIRAIDPTQQVNAIKQVSREGQDPHSVSVEKTPTRTQDTKPLNPKSSQEDQVVLSQYQQRENQVIAHERAHQAAGGGLTGGASYSYVMGPDGKRYISGGEVAIKVPSVDDPAEKLQVAMQLRRAALAPNNPSGQDRAVAATAAKMAEQARAELAKERYSQMSKSQDEETSHLDFLV